MKSIKLVVAVAALIATGSADSSAQTVRPRVFTPTDRSQDPPAVDVWIDRMAYEYGQRIRANFASEPGAYITIIRVTTDGELRVMYPARPSVQQQYREGQTVETRLSYAGSPTYFAYESGGTGFVFAIASYKRFDYRYYSSGDDWNVARLATSGRYGDPFEIVRTFVDRTLGESTDYTLDYVAYEVDSRNVRSRYATRYNYSSFDDYYDRCLSAFGYRYDLYCGTYSNGYYGGVYYGPIILAGPRTPIPNAPQSPREPSIKPLVRDPMVPTSPEYGLPQRTEGRFPAKISGEAAAAAKRERMLRDIAPRTEVKTSGDVYAQPRRSEPQYIQQRRAEPRAEPRVYREPGVGEPVQRREPVMRAEPQRIEPRVMQAAPPPRADPPRAEPPRQAPPPPVQRSEPARAKDKDQQQ
ncbi:MAG: hypothetical protein ABI556_17355 [Gemmatimonadales bacterium]